MSDIILYNTSMNLDTESFEKLNGKTFIRLTGTLTQQKIDEFTKWLEKNEVLVLDMKDVKNEILPENFIQNYDHFIRIYLPRNLKKISDGCFQNVPNLVNIEVPSTLCSIGKKCFSNSAELELFVAPKSLEYIGEGAFDTSINMILKVDKNNKRDFSYFAGMRLTETFEINGFVYSTDDDTILTAAAANGNINIIQKYIDNYENSIKENNNDFNEKDSNDSDSSTYSDDESQCLFNKVNHRGYTALIQAAYNDYPECVNALIPYEARFTTESGWTALMLAAQNGHVKCVEALLKAEAKITMENGWTALMSASCNGQVECVKLLIPYEAKMSVKNSKQTALVCAADNGYLDCVKELIPYESKIKMANGLSPLFFAVRRNHISCVALLLKHEKVTNGILAAAKTEEMKALLKVFIAKDSSSDDQTTENL